MSDIITRGQIVIDLVQGKIDLPKPDYDQIIKPAQQQLDITNAQNAATQQLTRTVEQQNSAYKAQVAALNEIGRRSFNEGKGDDKWQSGLESMRAAQEAERAETEKTNQLILADRARRHQRTIAMQEAEQRAQQQAAEQAIRDNRALNESIDRVGLGVMKVTRAAVLLGFAQDDSLQGMLQNLAKMQAGFDAFEGSRKAVQGLRDVMASAAKNGTSLATAIGSGNIVLAAGAVAVLALSAAWAAAAEKQKRYEEGVKNIKALKSQLGDAMAAEMSGGDRLALAQARQNRLDSIAGSGDNAAAVGEKYFKVEQDILAAKRAQKAEDSERISMQQQAIRNAQQQLDLAEQRLKTEQDATRSYEASFSRLQEFEQKRLKGAFDKLRDGKDINEYERSLIEKVGQGGITERDRAKEGRREGANAESDLRGLEGATVGLNGSMVDLQKSVEEFKKAVDKMTQNRDSDAVIRELEQEKQEIEQASKDLSKTFVQALRFITKQVENEAQRNKDSREAAERDAQYNAAGASTMAF